MKPTTRRMTLIVAAAFTIALISWDQKPLPGKYEQVFTDTTPKKSQDRKIKDLDDVLNELDNIEWLDAARLQRELSEAMKGLNVEKMQKQLEVEMKNIDMEKIMKEAKEAVASVDFSKINKEIAEAFKSGELQKELKASFDKIEWEKMSQQLEKVKEIDMKKMMEGMEKVKLQMEEIQPKLKEQMEKAKEEVEKAKVEVREFKGFIGKLHDEGLLDKNGSYKLEHKDAVLTVNGKEVSADIYRKHSEFLKKHTTFKIEKSEDGFDLDKD